MVFIVCGRCPFFYFIFMPLTREQKQNILKDLTDKFSRAKAAILIDFNKLSVSKTMELRRGLKSTNAEYKVAKKTLISRVLRFGHFKNVDLDNFKTQVGIVFSYVDPVATAQSVWKFSKVSAKGGSAFGGNEALKILGGFIDLNWYDRDRIITLAQLPPREVLLGQVVRTIAAPLSGLVNALSGNMRNLVSLLDNLRSKK